MKFNRAAGILLHPTSLPGRFGIGDLGDEAYRFVDLLGETKQTYWQILPLGPTGYGDSPYQSFSSFAGNPLLISPDKLLADGFLLPEMLDDVPDFPTEKVDFGWVIYYKNLLHRRAYAHFQEKGTAVQQEAFTKFCTSQAYWLDDYALFMALKTHHVEDNGGVWTSWPKKIAQRKPKAIKKWTEALADEIGLHKFLQFHFFKQWLTLKKYANNKGIKIIGDIPIFVAFDSADVWANPDLFFLNDDGTPSVIAGVPPDYFSETGQRWGNPLYRWKKMTKNNYAWWVKRLQMVFTQADIVRIDHFRGFDAYWEIPAEEETAVVGQWVKAPGIDFFKAIEKQLGELPIIAEDLGVITPEVRAMRDTFNFPGMKILQFAFGGELNSDFLPYNYDSSNFVVYTGTHDNETTVGWYQSATEKERDHVRRYLAVSGHDIAWDMIRLAWASVADTAIAPLQDLMALDNHARMNFPGKVGSYWTWRFKHEMLHGHLLHRLRELTELYGRSAQDNEQRTVNSEQ